MISSSFCKGRSITLWIIPEFCLKGELFKGKWGKRKGDSQGVVKEAKILPENLAGGGSDMPWKYRRKFGSFI
jgi:hypothetical protein